MNKIQKITERKPIEWKNQVVITTAFLAEVYGTDIDNVKKNFSRHKDNFIEGTHYFLLQGEELREFKDRVTDSPLVGKNANQLYLWTKRGASRHCKILDTDKAWEQFDNLEETYFKSKQSVIDLEQLDPQTKLMNLLVQSISRNELEQKRQAEQLNRIEEKQTTIEKKQEVITDTFQKTNDTEDFQKWANNCIARIAESPKFDKGQGRSKNYSLARSESYDRLKQKRNCLLDDRVRKAIGRALEKQPDIKNSELQKINKIYVIANDKDLRPAYELVIKEMMICYCMA